MNSAKELVPTDPSFARLAFSPSHAATSFTVLRPGFLSDFAQRAAVLLDFGEPNHLGLAVPLLSDLLEKLGKTRNAMGDIRDRFTEHLSGWHAEYFRKLVV